MGDYRLERTCRYCDATISQCDLGTVWTDQLSGDDGGTYDFCVESPTHCHAPADVA